MKRRIFIRWPLFLILICAAGCADLSYFLQKDGVLIVEPVAGTEPELARRILQQRFEKYKPSVFSSVDSSVESGRIRFIFHRGAPELGLVQSLVERRGKLLARLESGEVLYVDADIEQASASIQDGTVYLQLVATDFAALRIGSVTARNVGKIINVELDGVLLFRSTISGGFSKHFQLSADYPYSEIELVSALLDYGALPGPVLMVSSDGLYYDAAETP